MNLPKLDENFFKSQTGKNRNDREVMLEEERLRRIKNASYKFKISLRKVDLKKNTKVVDKAFHDKYGDLTKYCTEVRRYTKEEECEKPWLPPGPNDEIENQIGYLLID